MSILDYLDMVTKYGIPIIISLISIGVVIDFYGGAKKNWIPSFLKSFEEISTTLKSLNDNVHELSVKSDLIRRIDDKVDKVDVKLDQINRNLEIANYAGRKD